jgi:UDP-N-acetylglucosamine 2-epimerase (non-hydrolysing)
MKKILHVVGARPNFIKVAPIMQAMELFPTEFEQILVHTGQHYDFNMSRIFFDELSMREPDAYLGVSTGTHAEMTAKVMLSFEPVLQKFQPDWVVVVGDVNSTLACALVSAKLGVNVAHVEAGLRSWDRSMPEELNRLVTDQLADLLFTPSEDATDNLLREGIDKGKIHLVGNVMIDTLVNMLPKINQREIIRDLNLQPKEYILVTVHRPGNVDDPGKLSQIILALNSLSEIYPIVFPIHPRTKKTIESLSKVPLAKEIVLLEPQGYLDFLALQKSAGLVLTDSGGVQEETTYLGVPCLTIRPNTERPVTIKQGTNQLVDVTCESICLSVNQSWFTKKKITRPPTLWDGKAANRISQVFLGI